MKTLIFFYRNPKVVIPLKAKICQTMEVKNRTQRKTMVSEEVKNYSKLLQGDMR